MKTSVLDHSEWEALQAANGNPIERSCGMKMNSAQIEQTLNQFDAQAIPAGHPAMPQLERLFGNHTFFLDSEGLNIVEPVVEQNDGRRGVVVNLASWTDETKASLEPHEPESTELVVDLETDTRH
jgi:hypothetical protein